MDQPDLDAALHRQALAGLRRVNWISGTVRHLWPPIRRLAARERRPVRVLDLACGGGDVVVGLARRARRAGLALDVAGCDISPTALDQAVAQARDAGIERATFFRHDVLRDELPEYDVVTCSLFLHHLADGEAVAVLRHMAHAATRLGLVDDLQRSLLGYGLAWLGCRLLTRSPVVHVDGPRSVAAAFTLAEVRELARQAELADVRIRRHWPQRFLMSWSRS